MPSFSLRGAVNTLLIYSLTNVGVCVGISVGTVEGAFDGTFVGVLVGCRVGTLFKISKLYQK